MEDAARESGGVRVPAGSVRPLRRALGALESRVRDAFGSGGGKEAAWLDMRDGVYVRPRGVGPPRRKATSRLLLLRAAGEGVKGLGERQNGGGDVLRGDGRCG